MRFIILAHLACLALFLEMAHRAPLIGEDEEL
jgi:hypothetical protein